MSAAGIYSTTVNFLLSWTRHRSLP